MTQKISSVNIEAATLASFSGPTIANVSIANSSYTILDDTAVSNAGGYVVITGSNFTSGAQVLFGSTSACTVTFVDSTQLNVEVPALTAGSYVVYVQNGDGSTAIRLNGITSSPIPVWSTDSTLIQQDSGVPISISLAATSDSNVSYYLANGSSLPSGTTLAANGLFSGTVTITEETTYNFSVNAIDTENQETLRAFSVTVTAGDLYYNLTTLHLNGEPPADAWISDASTNKFALTVNGDTRPVAFSPYETVWSNFFDGNDTLTTPSNSAFTYGTSDFTVEGWFYFTGGVGASGYSYIFAQGAGTGSTSLGVYIQSGVFRVWNGSAVISSTASFVQNIWTHIAVTRSGTSMRLFVNGNLEGTVTNSNDITTGSTTGISIGRWSEISDTNYITGYVSNFRSVKGTAVYTANFTPPTSPLTAIENTSLLTCQSNRLIDNSTNNFTITRNGDVSVSNFGPFTETDLTTGSGYFDGNGDRLTLAATNQFAAGTQDFCFECWYYPVSKVDNFPRIAQSGLANWATSDNWALLDRHNDASTKFSWACFNLGGNAMLLSSTTVAQNNVWYHIAVTRSGSTFRMFINGTQEATYTNSGAVTTSSTVGFYIGGQGAGDSDINGYVSDARYIVGSSVYTSNFTPPTSPLTAIANTSLLTLQNRFGENNNRFVDTSGINNLITRNGNATQGTFSPFSQNGWSNYFDGTGDYLSVPFSSQFSFNADFTIEGWFNAAALPVTGSQKWIIGSWNAGSNLRSFYVILQNISGQLKLVLGLSPDGSSTNSTTTTSNTLTLNLSQWYHFAICRSSSTVNIYLNGNNVGSGTNSVTNFISGSSISIGTDAPGLTAAFYWLGYISNLRLIKGTAVYTSDFTPPVEPLTSITNTALLTCQSNRLIDNSTNNFTLTKNGDVSVEAFSPFKPTTAWSLDTVGGSGFFDGTGDYLSIDDKTDLRLGTNPFTIQAWIYRRAAGTAHSIIAKGGSSTGFVLQVTSTNVLRFTHGTTNIDTTTTIPAGTWTHVAVVREGTGSNQTKIYIDGISSATSTVSTDFSQTQTMYIGGDRSFSTVMNGFISFLRVNKGVAEYTNNFNVSTAPEVPTPGTVLLLNDTNGGIIDYTSRNNLETVGNVQLRSGVVKYGNNSLYFDGNNDYIMSPSNTLFTIGTGDFTLETWFYKLGTSPVNATNSLTIFDLRSSEPSISPYLYISGSGDGLQLIYYVNGATRITTSVAPSINQWYHVAIVRSSGITKMYLDGQQVGSNYTDSNNYVGTVLYLGGRFAAVSADFRSWYGYLDDVRITRYARYTSNFTPPTSAFKTR